MSKNKCKEINDEFWVKIYWTVIVWTKWQVVIPAQIRKDFNINAWDNLIVVTKHWKAIWMVKQDDIEEFMEFMKDEINDCKNTWKKK